MYEDILELSRYVSIHGSFLRPHQVCRRDLYSDAIRTCALNVILVQIGNQHTKKLIQSLTKWPRVELLILVSDLIEIFNPVWCIPKLFAFDPMLRICTGCLKISRWETRQVWCRSIEPLLSINQSMVWSLSFPSSTV